MDLSTLSAGALRDYLASLGDDSPAQDAANLELDRLWRTTFTFSHETE